MVNPKLLGFNKGRRSERVLEEIDNYLKEYSERTIYCDMDGVLTDFVNSFAKIDGRTTKEIESQGDDKFWAHVKQGGLEFWSKMPWMKDGKKLWDYIRKYNVKILSAPARRLPESNKGKQIWISRHLGNAELILKRAREKSEYANEHTILIDDMKKNINRWKLAGGIGILHTSASKTIGELKKLGF